MGLAISDVVQWASPMDNIQIRPLFPLPSSFFFPKGNTDEGSSRNNREQKPKDTGFPASLWALTSEICLTTLQLYESQLLCFSSPLPCIKIKYNKKNEWREETMWGEKEGEHYMGTRDIKAVYVCETKFSKLCNCSCCTMRTLNRVLLEFQLI